MQNDALMSYSAGGPFTVFTVDKTVFVNINGLSGLQAAGCDQPGGARVGVLRSGQPKADGLGASRAGAADNSHTDSFTTGGHYKWAARGVFGSYNHCA